MCEHAPDEPRSLLVDIDENARISRSLQIYSFEVEVVKRFKLFTNDVIKARDVHAER